MNFKILTPHNFQINNAAIMTGKLNFTLNPNLLILSLFLLLFSCNQNEQDTYKHEKLSAGLPEVLRSIENSLPFSNYTHAQLNADTSDSTQVFFGTFMQGSDKGYWVGLTSNDIPGHFNTLNLEEVDSLNYKTNDIDINFNEDRNRVSLRIIEIDSITIKYSWLDGNSLSENLVLKHIDKPLQKEIQFPPMNIESMSGEKVSSNQFKDKFIVINWWATWCKPCREEIPGLNDMAGKYIDNDNVKFIAITDDPKSRIIDFLKTHEFNYEMAFADQEVRTFFGNSYPVNLIVDPEGKITYLSKGAHSNTPREIENSLKLQMEAYNSNKILLKE